MIASESETLGGYIRKRRQELNLNQTDLGKRADLRQMEISAIENDKEPLGIPRLRRLAIALEIPLSELISRLP